MFLASRLLDGHLFTGGLEQESFVRHLYVLLSDRATWLAGGAATTAGDRAEPDDCTSARY